MVFRRFHYYEALTTVTIAINHPEIVARSWTFKLLISAIDVKQFSVLDFDVPFKLG